MFSKRNEVPRSRPFLSGFRLRLTALFAVLFGVTVFSFAELLSMAFLRNHQREFDAALHNYVLDVAHAIDPAEIKAGHLSPKLFLEEAEKIFPFALGETLLEVATADGVPLTRSQTLGPRSLPPLDASLVRLRRERTAFDDITVGDGRYRRVAHLLPASKGQDMVVQVAVPLTLLQRERDGLAAVLGLSIPLIIVIAAAGGLWISRRAMEPFTAIVAKAQEIQADQLSERVPVPRSNDEIRELAETLNGLLDRLESAFRAQEAFIADASHQLKTPLSILLTEMEMLHPRVNDPAAVAEFLASAAQEVNHLAKMVEELLQLARIEGGLERISSDRFRFDELVMEAASRLEPLARRRNGGFRLSLSPFRENDLEDDFELVGDPQLLRCLVENLLENAVKYSPPGAPVAVSLRDSGGAMQLEVRDQGPGISDSALPKVFDRFFRAETTRDHVSGSGLGLSLVKKIAELHGGQAVAGNHPSGGAVLTVELPKGSPEAQA